MLQACVTKKRIRITLDLDFPDIRAYLPGSYPGIWVLQDFPYLRDRLGRLPVQTNMPAIWVTSTPLRLAAV